MRVARRREGHYMLRSNLTDADPAKLWEMYLQLTHVEQACGRRRERRMIWAV